MKKLLMASAVALASIASTAQAATTITSPTTISLVNFGTGDGTGLQTTATANAVAMGYTFSGTGTGVYSGTGTGYTSPFGTTSNANYLAIQPNGSITYTFSSAQTTLSLLFGTIDSYNSITFTTGGVSGSQTFTGTDVMNQTGGTAGSTTKNIMFSGLNPFTTVTFSDTQASAFEFVPGAVPEPAAWGMMIIGFGLVGGVMRRRQTAVKVRFA